MGFAPFSHFVISVVHAVREQAVLPCADALARIAFLAAGVRVGLLFPGRLCPANSHIGIAYDSSNRRFSSRTHSLTSVLIGAEAC